MSDINKLMDLSDLPEVDFSDSDNIITSSENYTGDSHYESNENKSLNEVVGSTTHTTIYANESLDITDTKRANLIPDNLPYNFHSYSQGKQPDPKEYTVFAATTNNEDFRIYLTGDTNILSPLFHLQFAERMVRIQNMPNAKSITIEMGSFFGGSNPTFSLGTIISMIKSSSIPVNTIASSRCSFAESAIWLFGENRTISAYGALQFSGVQEFLKDYPMARSYVETIYERAISLGVLTNDDVEHLYNTNGSIFITSKGKVTKNS